MGIFIRVGTTRATVWTETKEQLKHLYDACSYWVPGAERSELYETGIWDGYKRLLRMTGDTRGTFPSGLAHRVYNEAQALAPGDVAIHYEAEPDLMPIDVHLADGAKPRNYQEEAVRKALEHKRCVLQVATGGGKTFIAALLISKVRERTLFVVHTKDLLYQAKGAFEEFLTGVKIGQIGDGVVDPGEVTVATIQTLARAVGVQAQKNPFDDADTSERPIEMKALTKAAIKGVLAKSRLVIWDEVHRIASDTAYGLSQKIPEARYRVGLSASPWRDDGHDMLIEAAMGPTVYKVSATYLAERGYLVPPIIRTVRVPCAIPWHKDPRDYKRIYKEEIVENEYRNEMVVKMARDFMERGITTLILVSQIRHGRKLAKMITEQYHPVEFVSGNDSSEKRKQAIQEMREGKRVCLVASTIADEGLDIRRLGALILAGGGKSSTRALQRIGRVLRPFEGKKVAYVVDFADEAKYLRVHAEKRKEIYRTEPGFTILEL